MPAAAVQAIAGPKASGKTGALIARVSGLLEQGVSPADVVVLTAGADAAYELRVRLASCLGVDAAAAPRVSSWRRFAWEAAGAPRVLSQPERSILLADLRTRGFSAQEVSHALEAAADAWSRGEVPACDAAQGQAGDPCLAALLQSLADRRAILPEALAAYATPLADATRVPYVLVDDADALPRAALRLVAHTATVACTFAGNPDGGNAPDGAESQAFLTFADAAGTRALPATGCRVHAGRSQVVKWCDAGEEASGTSALVDCTLARQAAQDGDCAGPVVLVAPNRAWARRITQSLEHAGIEPCDSAASAPLACDPRDPKGCLPLRCFAALALLVDRDDVASWRTWFSLGYPDLACRAWQGLEGYASAHDEAVPQVLTRVEREVAAGGNPFPGAHQIAARVREAEALFRACSGKRGVGLLNALDPAQTKAFRQALVLDEDALAVADAPSLLRAALVSVVDPSAGILPHEVRGAHHDKIAAAIQARRAFVCLGRAPVGIHPHLLAVLGANEGIVDSGALLTSLSAQADALVVSYIQQMPAEAATRLGAAFARTRQASEGPVALLRPSAALEVLGREVPPTMSGQQFCSAVLGVRP